MSNFYDQLCETFIRPSRQLYNAYDLGQPNYQNGRRIDFNIVNNRQYKILGSYYNNTKNPFAPCIVYLHSLNGSRLQSLPFVQKILEKGFNFCSFDFSGTGLSQGQYVSLGYHQKFDVLCILQYISSKFNIKNFILWGRSMGAAAAIKFTSMNLGLNKKSHKNIDYQIQALILDSPFQSLTQLTIQIAKQKINMPQIFIKAVLMMIQSTIQQKAGFKMSEMQLIQDIKFIKCPVLLLTSKDDKLVDSSHSQKIYEAICHKDRQIKFIKGQHNSNRETQTISYILDFILKNIEKKNSKINKKQNLVRSSKLLNYRGTNNLALSTAIVSKSSNKLHNISLEGVRCETYGDQEMTCARIDDDFKQQATTKSKQLKKAIYLYSPKVVNNIYKKGHMRSLNNNVETLNAKSLDEEKKISLQQNFSHIQNNLNVAQNYQYQSEKKMNFFNSDKVSLQLNRSPIKQPPKLKVQKQSQNRKDYSLTPKTPEKIVCQQNTQKISSFKQILSFSQKRQLKHLQLKNQGTQGTNTQQYPSIQVNHFNVINQKLRKKKSKKQARDQSPGLQIHPQNRYVGASMERKSQLLTKAQPSLGKQKRQNQTTWKGTYSIF